MPDPPNRPTGPNVKKLIIRRMAQQAIPPAGGFADGLAFLANKERLLAGAREATEYVFAALDAVKAAPGSTYTDDEVIAAEILQAIEAKRKRGE